MLLRINLAILCVDVLYSVLVHIWISENLSVAGQDLPRHESNGGGGVIKDKSKCRGLHLGLNTAYMTFFASDI